MGCCKHGKNIRVSQNVGNSWLIVKLLDLLEGLCSAELVGWRNSVQQKTEAVRFQVPSFFNLKKITLQDIAKFLICCIYPVHTPTNTLFINLVKSFKFTLKYTILTPLHASVFNDHNQGALSVPNLRYIYVRTLGNFYILTHSTVHSPS